MDCKTFLKWQMKCERSCLLGKKIYFLDKRIGKLPVLIIAGLRLEKLFTLI